MFLRNGAFVELLRMNSASKQQKEGPGTSSTQKPYCASVPKGLLQRRSRHSYAKEHWAGKQQPLLKDSVSCVGSESVPSMVHEVLPSPDQPVDLHTSGFKESQFMHDSKK